MWKVSEEGISASGAGGGFAWHGGPDTCDKSGDAGRYDSGGGSCHLSREEDRELTQHEGDSCYYSDRSQTSLWLAIEMFPQKLKSVCKCAYCAKSIHILLRSDDAICGRRLRNHVSLIQSGPCTIRRFLPIVDS